MKIKLIDLASHTNTPFEDRMVKGEVKNDTTLGKKAGVEVFLEGFGLQTMQPGHGPVVYIEHYEGKVKLYVWADINKEDPTHIIDLSGAKETERKPE